MVGKSSLQTITPHEALSVVDIFGDSWKLIRKHSKKCLYNHASYSVMVNKQVSKLNHRVVKSILTKGASFGEWLIIY